MASAGAAVVLAIAVCCLLVAPASARLPVDLPRQLSDAADREAAAEKLLPKPVQVADAEAADQATAITVQEEEAGAVGEERPQKRSSLLCLVFRCGGDAEPTGAGGVAVARGSFQQEAQPGAAEEVHREEQGAYDSDSDWDSDCDSDSDSDDEGGIVGWFWRLADGF